MIQGLGGKYISIPNAIAALKLALKPALKP